MRIIYRNDYYINQYLYNELLDLIIGEYIGLSSYQLRSIIFKMLLQSLKNDNRFP